MATTTTPTPIAGLNEQDQAFMDGFYDAIKESTLATKLYNTWGATLSKKPTYDDKLAYIRAIVNNPDIASKYRAKLPDLGVKWLVDSNPGIVDSKGDAFSTNFYKGIISNNAKTSTTNSTALKTAKTKVATESAKLANPKATKEELAAIVADIVNGSSTKPYNPATLTTAVSSTPSASLYKAGSMTADKLKSTYGSIVDPDTGESLFSDDYLKKVASATTASDVQGFNDTLSKLASKVLASQKGSSYLVQSDADKADALTNLLKNPELLASGTKSLYKPSTDKTGIGGLLPKGTFTDPDTGAFVYNGGEIAPLDMSRFVQTYNNQGVANRGAYVAPTFNSATGMYESKSTSPYANALTSLLGSVKNPFASDYTSSLATRQPAAMTSTQLANISKPFEKNTTARDIINLQNSAGLATGNDLTKDSSLSKNLLDLYQTNLDGSAIDSPWVADTEDMVIPTTTIPEIDTSTELVQLDPGGLLREQEAIDPNLAANQATAIMPAWWNEYNKGVSPEQLKANNAAFSTWTDEEKASVKSGYEATKIMPAWQRAGFNSQEEADAAGKLGLNAEDYYKSQRTPGTGIDTLVGGDTGQSKNSYYDPVNNPDGEMLDMAGLAAPFSRYGFGPDGTKHDYAKEGARMWNNQLLTDKEFKTVTDYYKNHQLVHSDNGKIQSGFDQAKLALWSSQFAAPTAVTGNDSIKAVTGNDSIKAVTGNDSIKAVTGNDSTLTPQVTLTKQLTPEEIAAQKAALVETPINVGIVPPNINNVVSKENLNTDVKGTNGESGVVPLLYADMAKNTGRVPTPMVQGWGGTPIPETSMTNTGTPVLAESLPNSNLDNQSYTITSNPNTPVGITSLVGPQQLTPQQLAQQQLLQSTGIGRS